MEISSQISVGVRKATGDAKCSVRSGSAAALPKKPDTAPETAPETAPTPDPAVTTTPAPTPDPTPDPAVTTTQWRKWAAAAAVFSALFLVYQIYSLINNFLMWMSSGTPRAQGDNLEGNPQCVHHVIGAKTVSFPALLVTLLVNVGVHFLLRTPSDEDLQRRVEQYKSENRDLRIQSQKTGGDRDIQKEVDAQIALTVQRYKIHYDTKERELEAEHIKEIDKLRAEIEGLKKPESPAEEVQMHDAQTNTDDWENTNTDWPQEARQEIGRAHV